MTDNTFTAAETDTTYSDNDVDYKNMGVPGGGGERGFDNSRRSDQWDSWG